MTEEIKNRFKDLIEYGSDDKVSLFLNNFRIASTEMKLQMDLKDKKLNFLLFFQDEIATFLIGLSFLINFIMSISLEKGYLTGNSDPQYSHDIFFELVMVLQITQLMGYIIGLMQTLILVSPVARDQWYEKVDVIGTTSNKQLSNIEKTRAFMMHYMPLALVVFTGIYF